jgi:ATP-dependent DNA helicase RecG
VKNADSLASEMAAFANTNGGTIFIGVADDGSTPGLSGQDVARINQLISNAASQLVRSPLAVQTENVALENGRIVIVLTVPKGIDKPYFDKNGVIWLKAGADKRRVNSKEELRRLFQFTNQFHADELPTKAGHRQAGQAALPRFSARCLQTGVSRFPAELTRLLQNMNLATDDGRLNLAGVLLFAEQPEWIVPQFVVKAIRYPGNKIHATDYLDTEDFSGPLPKLFEGALAFVMRNLHKVQAGRGVNAPGLRRRSRGGFRGAAGQRPGAPRLSGQRPDPPVCLRQPHRDHQPRPSAQQPDGGEDPGRELQHPQPDPGFLRRQGAAALSRPGLGHQTGAGKVAGIDFADDHDGCLFTATVHRKCWWSRWCATPSSA